MVPYDKLSAYCTNEVKRSIRYIYTYIVIIVYMCIIRPTHSFVTSQLTSLWSLLVEAVFTCVLHLLNKVPSRTESNHSGNQILYVKINVRVIFQFMADK